MPLHAGCSWTWPAAQPPCSAVKDPQGFCHAALSGTHGTHQVVVPIWQRPYALCSRSMASKGFSSGSGTGSQSTQPPAAPSQPSLTDTLSLPGSAGIPGYRECSGNGPQAAEDSPGGLRRCSSRRQVLPGADKGRGDERVGHGGDAVPRVGSGVIAVQRLTPLGPEVAPHHIQLVAGGQGMA